MKVARFRGSRFGCIAAAALATAAALLAGPTALQAQENITEVIVIHGGTSSIQPPPGYVKVNADLNAGAGGDFIYVCYKKGVAAPITGLCVTLDGGTPPPDAEYTKIDVDLNRNAGGQHIYLSYLKQ